VQVSIWRWFACALLLLAAVGAAAQPPMTFPPDKPAADRKPVTEDTAAERARLQADLLLLLKRINASPAPGSPYSPGTAPSPRKVDTGVGGKSIDTIREGMNYFRDNDFDAARKAVAELMRQSDPTAIVCVSDTLALGVMAGLRDLGMVPGQDVAVTGFDDIPAASLTAPGLTSLRQPMNTVGTLLVERLVALLVGEDAPASVLVEPDLIVRESTTGAVPDKLEENP